MSQAESPNYAKQRYNNTGFLHIYFTFTLLWSGGKSSPPPSVKFETQQTHITPLKYYTVCMQIYDKTLRKRKYIMLVCISLGVYLVAYAAHTQSTHYHTGNKRDAYIHAI